MTCQGIDYIYMNSASPSGSQNRSGFANLASGSSTNGLFRASVTFPQFSALGNWSLDYALLNDRLATTGTSMPLTCRTAGSDSACQRRANGASSSNSRIGYCWQR